MDSARWSQQDDDGFAFGADTVIDVEAEELSSGQNNEKSHESRGNAPPPRLADHFNTETEFHGQTLSQIAVHSLWIVDYLRGLGQTEMADGDLDSLVRCADDLESSIMLMFQLAGGTRAELHQRYAGLKLATLARHAATFDMSRRQ
ncbi:hypothetical protein V6B08_06935 [Ferrovibrio sp. MS7]|uniref:hypothetical protein n=1 Tax=Ferrovibrio plantarum TaxID=3119164 RepID=UPI001B64B0CA|nr:hypothetical protein [Ferrovibrio sp.]